MFNMRTLYCPTCSSSYDDNGGCECGGEFIPDSPWSYDPEPNDYESDEEYRKKSEEELKNWSFVFSEIKNGVIVLLVNERVEEEGQGRHYEYRYDLNHPMSSYKQLLTQVCDNFYVESHAQLGLRERVFEELAKRYEEEQNIHTIYQWADEVKAFFMKKGLSFISVPDSKNDGLIVFKFELEDDELPF